MVNVKKSRVIKGDAQKIWDLINQVERFPEWMPGVIDAKVTNSQTQGECGIGRRQILKTDTKLGKGETLQEVIVWNPPEKITWQHLKDVINGNEFDYAKGIKTTLSITNHDGKVTFRMVGSWEPVGIAGRLMNRVLKKTVARNFDQALRNLEKIIASEDD